MTIKPVIKGGQLIDIELDEVSLVESPANGRRFLFTKAADLAIEIKTDQTFDGTGVTVNGEELKDLDSFHFSVMNFSEEDMEEWGATPVSASWTIRESSEDGIDQVSTFSLQSTEVKKMNSAEVTKLIKSGFDVDITEEAFNALADEKKSSLTGFATFAPSMPEPFKKSTATAIKDMIGKEGGEEAEETEEIDPILASLAAIKLDLDALKAKAAEGASEDSEETTGGEAAAEDSEETEESETPVMKAIAEIRADLVLVKEAAGVKDSGEVDVEKADGDPKDDYKSWDL